MEKERVKKNKSKDTFQTIASSQKKSKLDEDSLLFKTFTSYQHDLDTKTINTKDLLK